ncbi:MAG: extracellular solute-binding protein [Treponema sp.]|nr:extracellular solute-binding protein [Treponema sp.]
MLRIKINKKLRNVIVTFVFFILIFAIPSFFPQKDYHQKYEKFDLSADELSGSGVKSYLEYLEFYKNEKNADFEVPVNLFDFVVAESKGARLEIINNKKVLLTEEDSFVSWTVNVPESGFYSIQIEYIGVPSRNVNMERAFYINGSVPFSGADSLAFFRLWKDSSSVKFDNRGNMIRPAQAETFDFQSVYFKSDLEYEVAPYKFYLKKGINRIGLEAVCEPMAISSLKLCPVVSYDSYEKYLAKKSKENPLSVSADEAEKNSLEPFLLKVQGEDSSLRSDSSLFARYDRSSAITEPYNTKQTVLNYTGGDSWKIPGQWIEWEFEIPQSGWYSISLKARQFYQRGYVACRSVYIDGEIPFDALKSVGFKYDSDWQFYTLCDNSGKNYDFYFEKGNHKIRLEATLGEIGKVVQGLQDSINRMNQIYRTILVLTGTNPDLNRDYEIQKVYPKEVDAMLLESRRLYKLIDEFALVNGEKSNQISPAEVLALQLEQFYKHPDKITRGFVNFKDNITTLASSMLAMTETKLDIDYIQIQNAQSKIKVDRSNFFKNVRHEISSFINSYFYDSSALGSVYKKGSKNLIEVWIVTGRDQSQVLKNIIDESFTPQTGINVNLKVIKPDSLLNAVVAGNGPDVVISTYQSQPVDYALRNANVNLRRFSDCEKVLSQFLPSSYKSYEYNGGLYALPEQLTFNLLFYRKDILEQLKLEVPQTWKELIELLPTLQGNNLTIGVPYPNIVTPDITSFYSMVMQNGGELYSKDGSKSMIDSEEGIAAFKTYTSLYNSYGLPIIYDFMSNFRTGNMPIGIANYTTYNSIVVGAPEIRGLWDFTYFPGTLDEKGNLNRANACSGVCTMMIKPGKLLEDFSASSFDLLDERTRKSVLKNEERVNNSWEFMKWWVSCDVQVSFGREMEALLGSAARYPTANTEALRQLSWNSKQIKILENSMKETVAVPEVPGSYYTARHVVNATRRIINYKDDERETLIDYTRKINEEINRKRREFNLPLAED